MIVLPSNSISWNSIYRHKHLEFLELNYQFRKSSFKIPAAKKEAKLYSDVFLIVKANSTLYISIQNLLYATDLISYALPNPPWMQKLYCTAAAVTAWVGPKWNALWPFPHLLKMLLGGESKKKRNWIFFLVSLMLFLSFFTSKNNIYSVNNLKFMHNFYYFLRIVF